MSAQTETEETVKGCAEAYKAGRDQDAKCCKTWHRGSGKPKGCRARNKYPAPGHRKLKTVKGNAGNDLCRDA